MMAAILDQLGVRYHLTGGVAVFVYGEPRMTQDFDLVVDQSRLLLRLPEFRHALQKAGYLFDEHGMEQAVSQGRPIQVLDSRNVLKLYLYPRELVPGELDRSQKMPVFGETELRVVALPDLVISKLIWVRKGSHKSRGDVRSLMRIVSPDVLVEIKERANDMKLGSLLDEVVGEPDEIEE